DLDERPGLEQPGDLHEAHGRPVRAHARPPSLADGPLRIAVLVQIGHEDQELDQVLGAAARRAHDVDDVVERRQELGGEVRADDARLLVEGDLPGDVEHPSGAAQDAVGVAARLGEVRRVDQLLLHGPALTFTPIGPWRPPRWGASRQRDVKRAWSIFDESPTTAACRRPRYFFANVWMSAAV